MRESLLLDFWRETLVNGGWLAGMIVVLLIVGDVEARVFFCVSLRRKCSRVLFCHLLMVLGIHGSRVVRRGKIGKALEIAAAWAEIHTLLSLCEEGSTFVRRLGAVCFKQR